MEDLHIKRGLLRILVLITALSGCVVQNDSSDPAYYAVYADIWNNKKQPVLVGYNKNNQLISTTEFNASGIYHLEEIQDKVWFLGGNYPYYFDKQNRTFNSISEYSGPVENIIFVSDDAYYLSYFYAESDIVIQPSVRKYDGSIILPLRGISYAIAGSKNDFVVCDYSAETGMTEVIRYNTSSEATTSFFTKNQIIQLFYINDRYIGSTAEGYYDIETMVKIDYKDHNPLFIQSVGDHSLLCQLDSKHLQLHIFSKDNTYVTQEVFLPENITRLHSVNVSDETIYVSGFDLNNQVHFYAIDTVSQQPSELHIQNLESKLDRTFIGIIRME